MPDELRDRLSTAAATRYSRSDPFFFLPFFPEDPMTDELTENPGWIADQLEDMQNRGEPGAVPGEVAVEKADVPVDVQIIQYDAIRLDEVQINNLQDVQKYAALPSMTWVNVTGIHDSWVVSEICRSFGVHGLVIEDIVNPHQRAKLETYDDVTYIVARMGELDGGFDSEQISIVLCDRAVLTFQERSGDCLEPIRKRLRAGRGRIRSRQHDYLVYAILDSIVDAYFPVLAAIGDKLNDIEQDLTEDPSVDAVAMLQRIRTVLFMIRAVIAPHQEAVAHLIRDERLISDDTRVYLRDCADHIHQVLEACDTTRELAADLRDYCFAEISFNQNETMKTLTVIASVFIPLSFIAGFYGMNFDPAASSWNMPETRWRYGYAFAISLMGTVTAITLAGLRWMSSSRRKNRRRRFRRTQTFLDLSTKQQ